MNIKNFLEFSSSRVSLLILALSIISVACNNNPKTGGDTARVTNLSADSLKLIQQARLIDSLSKDYQKLLVARTKARTDYYNKETKANGVVNPPFKDLPIDLPIGDVYMDSYRRSLSGSVGANNTRAVIITKKQLAFYLDYLTLSGEEEIQLSFGRYDKALLTSGGLIDRELNTRVPDRNNRYTLIAGLPVKPRPSGTVTRYTRPFEVGGTKFYDDWHEIWP
ncbi:MAG: hypothetical protein EOO01_17405 [Chitinophagaceae bacterium]|nr:MAG: hypothetical protein EOO01_17405 [Chitinophagaceae bacterium]